MQPGEECGLGERRREILEWAISTFVATGEPVGSRTIARHSREHLSAATVRNVMADLEEMGYLRQPHASAGRIPTDKAYRFYVDYMLQRHDLPARDRELIDANLRPDDSAEHLMARTSQLLSRVSGNLGIVVAPPISRVALEQIQFLRLSEDRILVVLISKSGIVQNRVIRSDVKYTVAELEQAGRYLSENFRHRTLLEVRMRILEMLREEKARYDSVLQHAIVLGARSFSEGADDPRPELYFDGASNLIQTPEFSDIKRMRLLFETIEEKNRLALLLAQCIRGDTQEVRITIGAENALPGIEECTLITSPYAVDGETQGSLGILGPTRMEYGRAISLVEYVARLFGRVMTHQGGSKG